jgi:rhodanese-related sulfurtransferase
MYVHPYFKSRQGGAMPTTGALEIDLEGFAREHGTAYLIDVREPADYVAGHVPGALLIPLGALDARTRELPRDTTIYIICASGNRSLRAARALADAGLDGVSVAGGTSAWIRSGRQIVTGESAS